MSSTNRSVVEYWKFESVKQNDSGYLDISCYEAIKDSSDNSINNNDGKPNESMPIGNS